MATNDTIEYNGNGDQDPERMDIDDMSTGDGMDLRPNKSYLTNVYHRARTKHPNSCCTRASLSRIHSREWDWAISARTFDEPAIEDQDAIGDEMQMEFDPLDNGDEVLCKVDNSGVHGS